MLRTSEPEDRDDLVQEIADQISEVGEAVVRAIREIKINPATTETKIEPRIEVNVPEMKQPVVQVKTEIPKPNPHPFANGCVCKITSRDDRGRLQEFTIKPL